MNERVDWIKLWENKIDYYEYHIKYVGNSNELKESFDYYIGMGETAISYLKYNLEQKNENLVISHKRVNKNDYHNPINITIDYRVRDIAEYLKEYIIYDNQNKIDIEKLFEKLELSRNEYILLYGRLLFPSYYFDMYDKIINKQSTNYELNKIIINIEKYEQFLSNIYLLINRKVNIPKVNWI